METNWNEILTTVLICMINVMLPVLLGLALAWLKPLLKKLDERVGIQMGTAQWEFTKDLIFQFVAAAEQQGVWDSMLADGKKKKVWVWNQIDKALKQHGIDLDTEAIDAAIEEAVFSINMENGKFKHNDK